MMLQIFDTNYMLGFGIAIIFGLVFMVILKEDTKVFLVFFVLGLCFSVFAGLLPSWTMVIGIILIFFLIYLQFKGGDIIG